MIKRIFSVVITIILMLMMAVSASAVIDPGVTDGSITVDLVSKYNNIAVMLYRVADVEYVNGKFVFTLTEAFKNVANVDFVINDAGEHQRQAGVLEAFARTNNIKEQARGTTNQNGVLVFSQLTPGVYLIAQDRNSTTYASYRMSEVLIPIPDYVSGRLSYQITAHPKIKTIPVTPTTPPPDYDDPDPDPTPRPSPSPSPSPSPGPTGSPEPPDDTTIFDGDPPIAPREPDTPVELKDPDRPLSDIPQTGLLVWPIPVLSICGTLMTGSGIYLQRKDKRKTSRK